MPQDPSDNVSELGTWAEDGINTQAQQSRHVGWWNYTPYNQAHLPGGATRLEAVDDLLA